MTRYDQFTRPVSYLSSICQLTSKINVKAGQRGFGDCLIGLELSVKDMGYILCQVACCWFFAVFLAKSD